MFETLSEQTSIAWDHLTIVNVVFTIAAVANAFTAGMAWWQSRRNARHAIETNEKIDENTDATKRVEGNVNGHLAALTAQLLMTMAENDRLKDQLSGGTKTS